MEAANDFAEAYMADYNRRFGKVPRHDFDVHRAVEHDLGLIFTVREKRKVSKSLTIQYDKMLYLIEDSELSRRAIGKYIDVYHYPDGRKELRLNGTLLPYSTYDRLSEIDQGAIVDNKRLGRTQSLSVWCRASGITRAVNSRWRWPFPTTAKAGREEIPALTG
jgi:hypothetical protein